MNKVLKGLVAVAASAAMATAGFAGVASTAMAADTHKVTVTVQDSGNLQNHSYTAYQILTGSQAASGGALGSTRWGSGINFEEFLKALKADKTIGSYFNSVTTSDQFVAALGNKDNFPSDSANANIVAKIALAHKTGDGTALQSGTNNLATGYYLIVDSTTIENQTVYNPAVLPITLSRTRLMCRPSRRRSRKTRRLRLKPRMVRASTMWPTITSAMTSRSI